MSKRAARTEIGSFEGFVFDGDNLLDKIFDDIDAKLGRKVTPRLLRHVTIHADDGNLFNINGFVFEIRHGIFCTPSNGDGNLIVIDEFASMQDCDVQVYYIR